MYCSSSTLQVRTEGVCYNYDIDTCVVIAYKCADTSLYMHVFYDNSCMLVCVFNTSDQAEVL